jgi:hypothetical protein
MIQVIPYNREAILSLPTSRMLHSNYSRFASNSDLSFHAGERWEDQLDLYVTLGRRARGRRNEGAQHADVARSSFALQASVERGLPEEKSGGIEAIS